MWKNRLLFLACIGSALLAAAVCLLWAASYQRTFDWTLRGSLHTFRFICGRGTLSTTEFANIAEDDFYRERSIGLWIPAAAALALSTLAAWNLWRHRSKRSTRGFPVQ